MVIFSHRCLGSDRINFKTCCIPGCFLIHLNIIIHHRQLSSTKKCNRASTMLNNIFQLFFFTLKMQTSPHPCHSFGSQYGYPSLSSCYKNLHTCRMLVDLIERTVGVFTWTRIYVLIITFRTQCRQNVALRIVI